MKKVLAIVLSIAMIFSFAAVAFAREIDEWEQAILAPKEEYALANPGEEITSVIEWKAALKDEDKEFYDENGTIVLPFDVRMDNPEKSTIVSVTLTDAAEAAGVKLTQFTNYEELGVVEENPDKVCYLGKIEMPAKYLFTKDAFDVLNVKVKVCDNWLLEEYSGIAYQEGTYDKKADNFSSLDYITYTVNAGSYSCSCMYEDAKVINGDGSEMYITMTYSIQTIKGKPYEPTRKDKVKDWFRKLAIKIIEFNEKILNFLFKIFAPAEWNS